MTLNEIKTWNGIMRDDGKPPMKSLSKYIEVGDGVSELHMWIAPDTDVDGTFKGICADTGEILTVNGWLGMVYHEKLYSEHGQLKGERVRLFV
jgi:hypothetical protein